MWSKQAVRQLAASRSGQRTKTTNFDYQYLQKSLIKTMHFQKSLPRLPIPKLQDTCDKYLAAQKPLLIEEAYRKTESNVKRFKETVGARLQDVLIKQDKSNKHTSYISEPWFDKYLKDRTPLPINYNPVLIFHNDSKPEYNDQAIRTTNLLISALRFYKSLKENILEPDVFHLNPKKTDNEGFRKVCAAIPETFSWYAAYLRNAYPLDMSQYKHLFNSTRIPEIDKDRIYSEPARHITIQHAGHFYLLEVLDKSGDILSSNDLFASIQHVLSNKSNENQHPLGILTTLERNKWASLRHDLAAIGNDKNLHLIDTALFNLCLDDIDIGDNKYTLVKNFLHGNGSNRWFDKSISLQVSKDGHAAVNFEHSWGDGVSVLRFFEEILRDSTKNPQVHPGIQVQQDSTVKKIEFNLNDQIKLAIDDAKKEYKKTCESLEVNYVESEGLGKKFCKKFSVSPDAIMQVSFQSAYYKQFGKFVPTYESCSTAAFKHGRTETIRPCTAATKKFCLAINSSSDMSRSELYGLLKECSNVHGQLTKEAAMGQGFDRHLFALRIIANKMDMLHENIFEDPAYTAINHNILSTSTLSSPAVRAGGFGPVAQDGLGIGYVIRDDAMGTLATTYKGVVDGKEFINCFKASIKEVVDILNNHTK